MTITNSIAQRSFQTGALALSLFQTGFAKHQHATATATTNKTFNANKPFVASEDKGQFDDEPSIDKELDKEIHRAKVDNKLHEKTAKTLEKYAEYVQATMLDVYTLGRPALSENLYSDNNSQISISVLNSAKELYELSAKKYLSEGLYMKALTNYQNIIFLEGEISNIKQKKPSNDDEIVNFNSKNAMSKLLSDPENNRFFKQNPPNARDQFGTIYYQCLLEEGSPSKPKIHKAPQAKNTREF